MVLLVPQLTPVVYANLTCMDFYEIYSFSLPKSGTLTSSVKTDGALNSLWDTVCLQK
jgi:hypothetical protein